LAAATRRKMIPTPLFLIAFLLAVPPMALSGDAPAFAWAALAWCGFLIALLVADNRLSQRAHRVRVERRLERKLSVGAENEIQVRVENLSRWPLRLYIKDDPPAPFETPRRELRVVLPGFGGTVVSYTTVPNHRGRFAFGDLHVRGRSFLALSLWQKRIPAETEVDVYPDILSVRRYDLLLRARRLEEAGFRRTLRRGAGTDFESLREYVPDDEYRRIDWKATARRGRPFTREYEEERGRTIMLLIDAGRMMSARVGGLSKLDHAVNAALLLAYVALRRDDSVGLIAFADRIKALVPPRKGHAHLERLLEELYDIQPTLTEPDYRAAMYHLHDRARKRSLAVLFTDLVDEQASRRLIAYTAAAYPRHLPMVVTISDPDLTRASRAVPETGADLFGRAVASHVIKGRQRALALLRRSGADVLETPAGELTVALVNRYLELKERLRV
jgi:uncharacterized protein (DUF58 family)